MSSYTARSLGLTASPLAIMLSALTSVTPAATKVDSCLQKSASTLGLNCLIPLEDFTSLADRRNSSPSRSRWCSSLWSAAFMVPLTFFPSIVCALYLNCAIRAPPRIIIFYPIHFQYIISERYQSISRIPYNRPIAMPMHRNGPKAKWALRSAFLAASR